MTVSALSPLYCKFQQQTRSLLLMTSVLALLYGSAVPVCAAALEDDIVIRGKNDWLFVRHEIVRQDMDKAAQTSFGLIEKFNRMLARNQIALAVVVVPSKMETYVEQLPDELKVSDYMGRFNDSMQSALRSGGVNVIDLKKPLRNAALQNTDAPVFFRLDTHWTPTGAFVAAQAIQAGVLANASLVKTMDAAPVEKFKLTWASKKQSQTKIRDITTFLPIGTPAYPPEDVLRFKVAREKVQGMSLLGAGGGGDISLVGSSFSGDWTGFSDALRYTLQRDILNFSVNADAGPWDVMRAYLRDDAFQTKKPKLIIWEIPERAIGLGPSYPYRQARYRLDDNDWLLQVAALSQEGCSAASITSKAGLTSLAHRTDANADVSTKETDFVEFNFDKPVDHLSYVSARIVTDGSNQITIEAYGSGGFTRKFTVDTVGNEFSHALKIPLGLRDNSISRIKIYPGNTKAFGLSNLEVCRYPEDWLK